MRVRVSVLIAVLAVFMVACGADTSQPSGIEDPQATDGNQSPDAGPPSGSVLTQVLDRGTLVAGVRDSSPPFGYTDDSGNLVGFEVDLVTELADALGVEVELVAVTADTRIPLLTQGRVDLLAATLSHYWDRDEVIDFSIGYFWSPNVVMVAADSGLTALADLADKTVGTAAGAGTIEELPLVVPGVQVESFQNYQDAFLALQQGVVDGVATDLPVLAGIRSQTDDPEAWTFIEEQYGASEFGIGLAQNDSAWRDRINVELQKMWLDGRWDAIFEKWLGSESGLQITTEQLDWNMTIWAVPAH